MTTDRQLEFDPIERAGELWTDHFGDPGAMKVATSIMRVQQILIGSLDAALKPYAITFARYEVLVLLTFSRTGHLPLSRIGERLMVHPTSVTNAIDRLEAQGLVRRVPDSNDRRRTLAALTPKGKRVTKQATRTLSTMGFGLEGLEGPELDGLYSLLRRVRESTGDFPADGLAPGHLTADDGESGVIDASHPACRR